MNTVITGPGVLIDMAINIRQLDLNQLSAVPMTGTDFYEQLPSVTAVYVMTDNGLNVLYVGKAASLKERWRPRVFASTAPEYHHMLLPALRKGGVSLRWITVDRFFIEAVESLLIHHLQPAWNTQVIGRSPDENNLLNQPLREHVRVPPEAFQNFWND